MSKYAYGGQLISNSRLMCYGVYAISKTADYCHLRITQVIHQLFRNLLAIIGMISGANNVYYFRCIQVCIAPVVQQDRGIIAIEQPLRIFFIPEKQSRNLVFFNESCLVLCSLKLCKCFNAVGLYGTYPVKVFKFFSRCFKYLFR